MSHVRLFTTIAAEPHAVLERFASIDGIRDWWTVDVRGACDEGAEFEVGFGEHRRQRLRVERVTPGACVEWRPLAVGDEFDPWQGTRIVCNVAPHRVALPWQTVGTAFRLEHLDWQAFTDFTAHCNTTWSRLLLGFKRMCEGGGPSPERWAPRAGL